MKKDLNKAVDSFFKKYELNNITIENIKNHFKNIKTENEYGNLLHAVVNYEYPEDKIIKFIETLLCSDTGVNVNAKGKSTGYSFIHLALYGYTKDGKDYSYSTEFIIKLITIAKKNNFNVNIVDNDGDSIVHTALASEVYTGSTVEIIKYLGSEYDISCKDKYGNDIISALQKYEEEAKKTNTAWYNRLLSEKEKIKELYEASKYNLEEINNKINLFMSQLDTIFKNINISYLLDNYSKIIDIKKQLDFYASKKQLFNEEKSEIDLIWSKYDSLLQKLLIDYIKKLSNNPNYKAINELYPILESFEYSEEIKIINKIKQKYSNHIKSIKTIISECETLNKLKEIKPSIDSITDKEALDELLTEYKEKYDMFQNLINQIKELIHSLEKIYNFLRLDLTEANYNFETQFDYNNMSTIELNQLIAKCIKQLANEKKQLKEEIKKRLNNLLETIFLLEEPNILSHEELCEIVEPSVETFSSSSVKRIKNKKRGL